jgi:tellurite resistance protein
MTENPIPWRVIRAAPDLLEAAQQAERELARFAEKEPQAVIALVAIRAAIAKANGELQPEERKEYAAK